MHHKDTCSDMTLLFQGYPKHNGLTYLGCLGFQQAAKDVEGQFGKSYQGKEISFSKLSGGAALVVDDDDDDNNTAEAAEANTELAISPTVP